MQYLLQCAGIAHTGIADPECSKLDFFHTVFLAGGGAKRLKEYMYDLYGNVVTHGGDT